VNGPITVRPATPADHAAIARFTVDAYRDDGQLAKPTGYEDVLADVATRAAETDLLVAEDPDGRVIGAVAYVLPGSRYAELSTEGEAEFRMLAVDPAAQGMGAGEALVRACLFRARAQRATAVVICVRDISHRAQKLYAKLGFVRVPELDWSPFPGVLLLALRRSLPAADEIESDLQ
jgi:ribosomal protein S18 acetylase RimI-like enzyme